MTRKIFFHILILAALLVTSVGAVDDKPFRVIATVDKTEISVGDLVKLTVMAENVSGYDVLFPDTPEQLGDFTFIGARPIEKGWPKAEVIGYEYVLSTYDTGTRVIPPVQVSYRESDSGDWQIAESAQVPIEIKSLLTAGDEVDVDIKDLKALALAKRGILWIFFVVIAGLVIAWALWLFLRKKMSEIKDRPVVVRPAYEIAYEELSALKAKNLPAHGLVKEYYSVLSDIVRRYIENRFAYRAPEMTTEEFLAVIKNSPEMKREYTKLLKDFLSHCDMVKFAKYGPTELEMLDSYNSAEHFVDETKMVPVPVEEETK